ncbi:restriction endonuclease subunit S [Janthinobacterium sp. 78]|uniref:restriction endonuclease subunit S n=1 Tax=Janthinobacterium sp. 78 TaxID=2135631 RepID=UPI000D5E2DAF|nr:restriction endonuclease subunit S [Janthinobacterium sp. 78]PVX34823.1 type I restriction enzyme S subunit [Janthinobacterium sp. 78]
MYEINPAMLRSLDELADTNPETLSSTTAQNFRFRYVDLGATSAGSIHWKSVAEVSYATSPSRARRVLRYGDVLFGTVRPNLQSHGYFDRENIGAVVASTGFSVIRAKEGVSDSRYLFHCVMSSQISIQANRDAVGSSYPALNDGDVRRFKVFTPPIVEQTAIAKILDTLDTIIRQTEAIIEKLKQVKQGLLHDLLTRGIGANGELRPPQSQAPHLYKDSPLGWIPTSWCTATLGEIAEIRSGTTPARSSSARYYCDDGIPWVKTMDLNEGDIQKTSESITAVALRECSCERLPVGSVLIAMYGGWEQIGRTGILQTPAATNQAISALIFTSADLEPEYVLRAVQHGRKRWAGVAASTRKDPNITKGDVQSFRIALPNARSEQKEIVRIVSAALAKITLEIAGLHKMMEEKAGLMDDLLTGRVRVTPLLNSQGA